MWMLNHTYSQKPQKVKILRLCHHQVDCPLYLCFGILCLTWWCANLRMTGFVFCWMSSWDQVSLNNINSNSNSKPQTQGPSAGSFDLHLNEGGKLTAIPPPPPPPFLFPSPFSLVILHPYTPDCLVGAVQNDNTYDHSRHLFSHLSPPPQAHQHFHIFSTCNFLCVFIFQNEGGVIPGCTVGAG